MGLVAVALLILGPLTLLATCTMRRLSVSGSAGDVMVVVVTMAMAVSACACPVAGISAILTHCSSGLKNLARPDLAPIQL